MFKLGKKPSDPLYDKTGKIPVIRSSICTGERVAGFLNPKTGKFEEIMLIRTEADLREFTTSYHVSRDELRYDW